MASKLPSAKYSCWTYALTCLHRTVEGIRKSIDEKAKRGIAKRVFSISVDKEDIAKWKEDLARYIATFNMSVLLRRCTPVAESMFQTKLNIAADIKLDLIIQMFEVGDIVATRSHYLSSYTHRNSGATRPMGVRGAWTIRQGDSVVSPSDRDKPVREPPPPRPSLFLGRDSIVRKGVEALLKPGHVALLGAGGIGKTSIAKAILNDDAIVERYQTERHFVSFDDLDTVDDIRSRISTFTFLSRLASALGLQPSKADLQKLVMWQLQSSPHILLVLDNAETILDGGGDSGHIASAIVEIAALPSVSVLFTTRSAELPYTIGLETVSVPPLDSAASHDFFAAVYGTAFDAAIIGSLLAELDFHPLSIHLLAQAARQNQWSSSVLAELWREQKTNMFKTHSSTARAGKNQSLSVSIDLSLKSREFASVNPNALHLLQIISFLPQGINTKAMGDQFPHIRTYDAQITIAILCKLSLAYRKGDFVTVLSPIRMHILASHVGSDPSSMPLLTNICLYYRTQLNKFSYMSPTDFNEARSWFVSEDLNVEHTLAYELETARGFDRLLNVCHNCESFFRRLYYFKLRWTSLENAILSLPSPAPKRILGFPAPGSNTNRFLLAKSYCLHALHHLAKATAELSKALGLLDAALLIHQALRIKSAVGQDLYLKGDIYRVLGRFSSAKKVLTEALQLARSVKGLEQQAYINASLSILSTSSGDPAAAEMLAAAQSIAEKVGGLGLRIRLEAHQAFIAYLQRDNKSARCIFEGHIEHYERAGDKLGLLYCYVNLSCVSVREGDMEETVRLLDTARKIALGVDRISAAYCLAWRATVAVDNGDIETARAQIAIVLDEVAGSGNLYAAATLYLAARIELLAGDLGKSRELFEQSRILFDALSDLHQQARVYRALGEISLLQNDTAGAVASFKEAQTLCESMPVHPDYLYVCWDHYILPDRFKGWKAFLDGRLAQS